MRFADWDLLLEDSSCFSVTVDPCFNVMNLLLPISCATWWIIMELYQRDSRAKGI